MQCPFRQTKPLSPWQKTKYWILSLFNRQGISKTVASLEAILNTTIDSVITCNEQGIIQSCNHATEKMFGYSDKDLLGKNVAIFQPEPYHSEHDTYIQNYLRTGVKKIIGRRRELIGKTKNGALFPIDLFVTEMFIKKRRFFLATIRDVSERTQALIEKEKSLKLETELTVKNDFLAIMSHELKTPLHSIMGFTDYLLNELDGPLNDLQKGSLKQMYSSSQHLLGLINGLLELSKTEANQHNLELELCNLIEILENAIQNITPLAQKKNLLIIKSIPSTECLLKANKRQISEIFLNLLDNSIKFTENGSIHIQLTRDLNYHAIITIQDTGCGIEEEALSRIFVPFAPTSAKLDPLREHTGLGLAITKRIIELYQGTIKVSSKKGVGSTFTITLPTLKTPI